MAEPYRSIQNPRLIYHRDAAANHEQPPNRNLPSILQPRRIAVSHDGENRNEESLADEDVTENDISAANQNVPEDEVNHQVNVDQAAANFSFYLQPHFMNQPADDRFFRACSKWIFEN